MIYMYIAITMIAYVSSFYGAYKYIQISYSKGGTLEDINPDIGDAIMVLFPILNTYVCTLWLAGKPVLDNKSNKASRFFKIKK